MATKTQDNATPARDIQRLRDLKVGVRDMVMLDPAAIRIEPSFNCRNYRLPENHAHLDELKISISKVGVQVPLLVRFDAATKQAILVDGECRLRAVLELIREGVTIPSVPVIQVPGNNEADRLILSLTANTGKPLSQWEAGKGFQRLIGLGYDVAGIADKLGYQERYVARALELADAPDDVKVLLSERAVTPSLAIYHLRTKGTKAGEALREDADRAKAAGKTTATRAGKSRAGKSKPKPNGSGADSDTDLVLLEALVRDLLDDDEFDWGNGEYRFVEVAREKLASIAQHLGYEGYWSGKGTVSADSTSSI